MNAYWHFRREQNDLKKAKGDKMPWKEFCNLAYAQWTHMSKQEREPYEEKEAVDRARY